jgi:hypothetical protein
LIADARRGAEERFRERKGAQERTGAMTRVNSLTIWMSDGPHRNLGVGCTFPHSETLRYREQFIANLIFDTVR